MLLAAWRNIKMDKENIGYGLPIPLDLLQSRYVMFDSKLAVAENDDVSAAGSHSVPCNYTFCKSKPELRLKIVGLMEAAHGAWGASINNVFG